MPIPNAIVHITMRSGVSGLTKEAMMESFIGFLVTLVYMSTRRNIARFGAPTGSVNSFLSAE